LRARSSIVVNPSIGTLMELNNLSDYEQEIADEIWAIKDGDGLMEFLANLDLEDRELALALVALMKMGGDAVDNTQDAKRVIDKFRL
jgi:hypothetical protein